MTALVYSDSIIGITVTIRIEAFTRSFAIRGCCLAVRATTISIAVPAVTACTRRGSFSVAGSKKTRLHIDRQASDRIAAASLPLL